MDVIQWQDDEAERKAEDDIVAREERDARNAAAEGERETCRTLDLWKGTTHFNIASSFP